MASVVLASCATTPASAEVAPSGFLPGEGHTSLNVEDAQMNEMGAADGPF
jgi:hypothetical protein